MFIEINAVYVTRFEEKNTTKKKKILKNILKKRLLY